MDFLSSQGRKHQLQHFVDGALLTDQIASAPEKEYCGCAIERQLDPQVPVEDLPPVQRNRRCRPGREAGHARRRGQQRSCQHRGKYHLMQIKETPSAHAQAPGCWWAYPDERERAACATPARRISACQKSNDAGYAPTLTAQCPLIQNKCPSPSHLGRPNSRCDHMYKVSFCCSHASKSVWLSKTRVHRIE